MLFCRWLLKIPWTEHVSNQEVSRKVESRSSLILRIDTGENFEHIMKKEDLANLTLTDRWRQEGNKLVYMDGRTGTKRDSKKRKILRATTDRKLRKSCNHPSPEVTQYIDN